MMEIKQIAEAGQENRDFLKHFSASAALPYAFMGFFDSVTMKFDQFWMVCREDPQIENRSEFVKSLGRSVAGYLKVNQAFSGTVASKICRMQKEKNLWITSGEVTIGIGENAGSLVPIIGFPTGAFDDTLNRQALFRMGLTYVVQALNKTLFMNADWNEGIYRTVMPLLSVEFVVVDKRGCIVHDARSGAIAADAPPGLEPAGQEQIVHLSDAGGAEFQNAVAAAVSAERKTTLVPVLGPDEMPRLVLVTPLEAAQSGHALVIYEGEDSDTTWLLDQLFGIYRLTRSEKQVARGIVLGKTVTEIAADADWSVATVRSYVKQVLSKMGLHRQSELIQLYHSSKLPIVPKPEMRLTARPA